jgi:hypothetical protein
MSQGKDATSFSAAANAARLQQLNWDDNQDYATAANAWLGQAHLEVS